VLSKIKEYASSSELEETTLKPEPSIKIDKIDEPVVV
jgi:hypothetical protein